MCYIQREYLKNQKIHINSNEKHWKIIYTIFFSKKYKYMKAWNYIQINTLVKKFIFK